MNGLFGPYIEKWMHLITIKKYVITSYWISNYN